MSAYSVQGRTVFITGGGSGIGAEVARQCAQRGARLALVDVDIDGAEQVAASLPEAIAIQGDVRDHDSLLAAAAKTAETFGGIDIALANAGIEVEGTARGVSLRDIERIADINFTGVMRTVKATLPYVIERRGYVLITASLAAILHAPPLSHYSATKAGVEAFGNAMRPELRELGVDVGVAYFAIIDTPMVERGRADPIISDLEAQNRKTFLSRTYPVSGAAAAVVAGIESRSRRVMYPGWLRGFFLARAAVPRLVDATFRQASFKRLIERLDERDLARSEEATALQPEQDRLLS